MSDERVYCTWTNAISSQCPNIARYTVVVLVGTSRIERRIPRCEVHVMEAIEFSMQNEYPYWFKAVEPVT